MASKSTFTLGEVLNWIAPLILLRPTVGIGPAPSQLEPALTTANKILAQILQPPFAWSWNRLVMPAAFTTEAGVSDYPVSIATFGFLEKAVLNAPGQTPDTVELEIFPLLGQDGKDDQPLKITVLSEDDEGMVTFRVFPTPDGNNDGTTDQNYTVDLLIQQAPNILTTLAGTFAPIPDRLMFLYMQPILATMQMMYNVPLGMQTMELFYRMLIAAAEGLTETQKAIFLEDSLRILQTQADAMQSTQQGKQARQ